MARLSEKQLLFVGGLVVALAIYFTLPGQTDDRTATPGDLAVLEEGEVYLRRFKQFQSAKSEHFEFAPNKPISLHGRNPFVLAKRRPGSAAGPVPGDIEREQDNIFVLSGILWDVREPAAVVNDTVVGVGSEVGKYRVIQITETNVLLKSNRDELKLELPAAEQ